MFWGSVVLNCVSGCVGVWVCGCVGVWVCVCVSALAWAQVALASDYARMTVMRAMHKSVRPVYSASPWNAENTMRAVYAIAHHQPCAQSDVVTRLIYWLSRHAKWRNKHYTDTAIPTELQP